jgi:hypothetical protein
MAMACSILESTIEKRVDCPVGVCAPAITFVGKLTFGRTQLRGNPQGKLVGSKGGQADGSERSISRDREGD